jgi:hypothetical protein
MIPLSMLAAASILAVLFSCRHGDDKGYKAGNYVAQCFEECLAELPVD